MDVALTRRASQDRKHDGVRDRRFADGRIGNTLDLVPPEQNMYWECQRGDQVREMRAGGLDGRDDSICERKRRCLFAISLSHRIVDQSEACQPVEVEITKKKEKKRTSD